MASVGQIWSQMFPPTPEFTEKGYPEFLGKVFSPLFLTFPPSANIDFEC
jgi:hypothetical protein